MKRPTLKQRLPIIFLVTTLKYEQKAKDYRHLRYAFNMKLRLKKKKREGKSQLEEVLKREINFPKLLVYLEREDSAPTQ